MPVVKTLTPDDADILTQKIFACDPDEESDVVIDAVREHINEWGYAAHFHTNTSPKKHKLLDLPLRGKCIIYLIQGSFELGAELIDVGDREVVEKKGLGYAVEEEVMVRLRGQSAVVVIYVEWEGDLEMAKLGPQEPVRPAQGVGWFS